jgi:nitrate/TMAO reductase-like tetraheme cytochrome c subunit
MTCDRAHRPGGANNRVNLGRTLATGLVLLLLAAASGIAFAAEPFLDDESCLICHKYPMMGRITQEGVARSYYIVPELFGKTVHRNVPCRDCHKEIQTLPHDPIKQGVRCDSECHTIKNPATGQLFSHKTVYDRYRKSVHGRQKTAPETESSAPTPYCIDCHTNPLYNPAQSAPPEDVVKRCVVCHEDRKFVVRWYNHTSRRILGVQRSSAEIVALCSSCHGDPKLVSQNLEQAKSEGRELGRKFPHAVESYLESFHGKMTRFGFTAAANCLDCHADNKNYFLSVHEIRPSRDPESPVSSENRVETCRRCHTYADKNYALLDPHPTSLQHDNPFRYWAELVYNIIAIVVIIGLVGVSMFETVGRRRDGVAWRVVNGTSWRRRSNRGRDRVVE